MTQEEKAKAYDEALEQSKRELNICGSLDCDAARQIFRFFPQLKESEDERIRKAILGLTYIDGIEPILTKCSITAQDIRAYLEKQKEQNKITIEQVYKEFITPEKLKDAKTNKYIRAQLLWELMHNGIITEVDYMYLTDGKRKPWTAEEYRIAYQKGFEMSEQLKQKEQKPAEWRPTHEQMVALSWAANGMLDSDSPSAGDIKASLRTLYNDLQSKSIMPAEWSEEDNIGWDEAFACVTRSEKAAKNEEELQNAVTAEKWLKEIKFKYYVHPVKQEWSEEDERNKDRAVFYARYYQRTEAETKGSEECISWLKSLRPQPHTVSIKDATKFGNLEYERGVKDGIQSEKSRQWKPSDEQIRPLEYAIDYFKKKKNDVTYLESLYEDLKKL